MIAITKGMLVLTALLTAGFVTAIDMVAPRADDKTAAMQVAERFPLTSEMFAPVSFATLATSQLNSQKAVAMDRKGDKLPLPTADCSGHDWPYIAQDCLVSSDGNPVRKVTRVITVERRTGDNSSELLRLPVTDMAQR
jgi:hypothetical protein